MERIIIAWAEDDKRREQGFEEGTRLEKKGVHAGKRERGRGTRGRGGGGELERFEPWNEARLNHARNEVTPKIPEHTKLELKRCVASSMPSRVIECFLRVSEVF